MTVHPMNQPLKTLQPDRIVSSLARCDVGGTVTLSPYVIPQAGYAVAVRALEEKAQYNQVECTDGQFRTIRTGDVLVGVLGERQALKGYSGHVPRELAVGDTLHVLNLGGILGTCDSVLPDLGPPLKTELLGAVMTSDGGTPTHVRIQDRAIEPMASLTASAPLVTVSGTAMNTGKTMAACRIVQGLTEQGYRVAAAKLTGASLMRDVRKMQSHGAIAVSTFTDAGVICSTQGDMAGVAKGIIHHLNDADPDVIVLELGDGFVGYYGVDDLLVDRELQIHTQAHVVAATDLAGAWAAERMFFERYRSPITAITGPVTDNAVGRRYIQNRLGISAINALQQSARLAEVVGSALASPVATDAPPASSTAPTLTPPISAQAVSGIA